MSVRFPGFMAAVVPTITLLPFAAMSLAPWSASDAVSFALPLITLAAIFFWTLRLPRSVPVLIVFLIGLLTDLVDDGPLGYWALLYLVGYAVALHAPIGADTRRDGLQGWGLFAATAALVTAAGWSVASIYYVSPVAVVPLITGGSLAAAAYGPASYLLAPLESQVSLWRAASRPVEDGA